MPIEFTVNFTDADFEVQADRLMHDGKPFTVTNADDTDYLEILIPMARKGVYHVKYFPKECKALFSPEKPN